MKLCSLNVKSVSWKPDFVGQLIFLAVLYTMRPCDVGEVDRLFPSSGSSCVAAVLVRLFQERCLLAAVCPPPFFFLILASSCPSSHLSLYPSLFETGPPSDWVNESRVPLKA